MACGPRDHSLPGNDVPSHRTRSIECWTVTGSSVSKGRGSIGVGIDTVCKREQAIANQSRGISEIR